MAKQSWSKDRLSKLGSDTAKIITLGTYNVERTLVDISDEVHEMIENTLYYRNTALDRLEKPVNKNKPKFVVSNKDTVKAVEDQVSLYGSSCALNFASAKYPGGGFLTGAMAQEEAICYRTTLYGSLSNQIKAYEYSRSHLNNGLYSTWVIYSPNVRIIRDKNMNLVLDRIKFSAITCPAPNRSVYKGNIKDVNKALYERCKLILEVAALNGEKNLVLGAFGCGVFKNNPKDVAEIFYKILVDEEMMYYFDNIEFAILGNGMDSNFREFNKKFG